MKKTYSIFFAMLVFSASCTLNVNTPNNTANAPVSNTVNSASTTAENKPAANQPANTANAPVKEKSESTVQGAERIQLPKGEQVAVISGTLGGKQSKKYVAYVIKGNMICIVPSEDLNANIKAKLDGKEFDFRDSTCSEHLPDTKDHIIEIYNSGSGNAAFNFDVGFSEHG